MKTTKALGAFFLVFACLCATGEGALVVPPVGVHTTFNRSFNSGGRRNNATITSVYNNGSLGVSLGRSIHGVGGYNIVGSYSPNMNPNSAASRSIYGTVTSSYNSPFGGGASTENFSTTIPGAGNFPTTQSIINQPLSGVGLSSTSPFYTGGGIGYPGVGGGAAFQPDLYGGGGDVEDGGPPETPDSTVLKGEANVMSAAGQYNRETAAAAVQATEADSQAMKNAVDRVKTFYAVREAGRIARENARGPRPDAEELARRARAGVPRALTTNQIDPVSGDLHWPGYFEDPRFQSQRTKINDYAVDWVHYGKLSFYDRMRMRENVGKLLEDLNSQIDTLPPQEYTASRSFLSSLLYATTHSML